MTARELLVEARAMLGAIECWYPARAGDFLSRLDTFLALLASPPVGEVDTKDVPTVDCPRCHKPYLRMLDGYCACTLKPVGEVVDERARFEKWAKSPAGVLCDEATQVQWDEDAPDEPYAHNYGDGKRVGLECEWAAWMGRAALPSAVPTEERASFNLSDRAPVGVVDAVAILRECVACHAHNGKNTECVEKAVLLVHKAYRAALSTPPNEGGRCPQCHGDRIRYGTGYPRGVSCFAVWHNEEPHCAACGSHAESVRLCDNKDHATIHAVSPNAWMEPPGARSKCEECRDQFHGPTDHPKEA